MNGFAALDIHPHRRYVVDIGGRRSSRCRLHINFAPFLHSLDFTQNLGVPPQEVRRLIYTTNTIESFNRQLRKVTKSKSVFPTDDSLLKMLYLAMMDITKKWTGRRQDWSMIHAQMAIYFAERMPESPLCLAVKGQMNGFAALDIHPHRRYVVNIGGRRSSRCRLHINFALFLHSLDFTQNLGVTHWAPCSARKSRIFFAPYARSPKMLLPLIFPNFCKRGMAWSQSAQLPADIDKQTGIPSRLTRA